LLVDGLGALYIPLIRQQLPESERGLAAELMQREGRPASGGDGS
jgi:hypothetical protein